MVDQQSAEKAELTRHLDSLQDELNQLLAAKKEQEEEREKEKMAQGCGEWGLREERGELESRVRDWIAEW